MGFAVVFIAIISMSLAKRARRSRMDLTKPSKDLNSCTRLGLTDTTFKAECVANNLAVIKTEVDLSKCISNNNGVLTFSGAHIKNHVTAVLWQMSKLAYIAKDAIPLEMLPLKKLQLLLLIILK